MCFCLISGHLSSSEIDERRARGLCQLFATYVIFQILYYVQNMLSYRLNGFPYPALPVPLFSPQGQVVTCGFCSRCSFGASPCLSSIACARPSPSPSS